MKKFLMTIIVLGLIGGGGYYLFMKFFSPEKRTCGKLAELCGQKGQDRAKKCEEGLGKFKKAVGEESYKKAVGCVDEAKSCMGAAGCMAGAGMSGLGQFLGGMLKGLDPNLKQKGQQLLDKLKRSAGDSEELKKKAKELMDRLKESAESR